MSAGLYHGTFTLPAAGSQPVQMDSTPQSCKSVLLHNPTGNSTVYFGGVSGTATLASTTGIPLAAGATVSIPTGDTGSIYLVGTEADVVRFIASDNA